MTIAEMKEYLASEGFVNLRAETERFNYIMAERDGRTYCLDFGRIHAMKEGKALIIR